MQITAITNFHITRNIGSNSACPVGEGFPLAQVKVNKDMPVEKALRKFRSICKKEGIIDEVKKRRAYEKPSSRKRRKVRRRGKENNR